MKTNQKGFSAVVILLALILVAIVGFTGYYVWNTQQDKKDNSQAAGPNTTAKSTPTPTPDTQKYLVIKEWGVKVPLSDKINDATYIYTNGSVYLSTQSLTNKYPECAADKTTVFAYGRYDNPNAQNPDDPSGTTTYGQSLPNAPKIGNYYYYGVRSQAPCAFKDTQDLTQQEDTTIYADAFEEAIKNVKAN